MANTDPINVALTLEHLTQRITRVEHHLGLEPPPPEVATPKATAPKPKDLETPTPEPPARQLQLPSPAPTQSPPTPPPIIPTRKIEALRNIEQARASHTGATEQPIADAIAAFRAPPIAPAIPTLPVYKPPTNSTPARQLQPPSAPAPQPKQKRSVELAIGRSWLAWIGAIVILLAGALFITTAYREGWITKLPLELRCAAVAVFGVLLIAAGEWAVRNISRLAAVGFFSAGLGTLYLDAYATSAMYHLIPETTAFILLAIVALLGFVLTLRAHTLTVGVLSVIGGYLAPFLLGSATANPIAPALYFTCLLAIALGLSMFARKPMRALRYVAIAAHMIMASLWAMSVIPADWQVGIVMFTLWWSMIVVESVVAAVRNQSAIGNVIATMLASAWFIIVGGAILNLSPTGFNMLGAFTFAIGALSAALAFQFGPGIESLRTKPRSAMDKLSLALMLQAGVLMIVAVALQFDGMAQAVAWLTMGIAAIELGRRLPSRGMDIFGLVVGGLGVGIVILLAMSAAPALTFVIVELPGMTVTGWTALAIFTTLLIFTAGKRLRAQDGSAWLGFKSALIVTATVGWFILFAHEGRGLIVTWFWLFAAVALIVLERFGRRETFFEIGLAALGVVAARWLLADAVADRMSESWSASSALPVLNWQMGLAVAIAFLAWLAVRIARTRPNAVARIPAEGQERNAIAIILSVLVGSAFMLFALSFEVDRMVLRIAESATSPAWSADHVLQLMLTALWATGAITVQLFAYSLRKRGGAARAASGPILRAGWITLLLCVTKLVIIDMLIMNVLSETSERLALLPLLNVQMLVLLVIGAGMATMYVLTKRDNADLAIAARSPFDQFIALTVPTLISVLVLWGLSFEVERFIATLEEAGRTFAWPGDQVRTLALTMLWTIGAFVIASLGKWRRNAELTSAGLLIAFCAAMAWLSLDTLHFRLQRAPMSTQLFFNMQFIAGAVLAGVLVASQRLVKTSALAHQAKQMYRAGAWVFFGVIVLWLGSFEIDRAFIRAAETLSIGQVTARQMCWSVYWSLFAFSLIAIGFKIPSAWVRYAGISMFGITLAKVLLIDLSQIHNIYRVASLLAVGVLLVITSMAYAKLAPMLLGTVNKEHTAT